jgi:hypothetical protein
VLCCLILTILVLVIIAGYTVGIVSRNSVIAQIDSNMASMTSYLEKNEDATEQIMEELKEDYSAKTRTIAMLLGQDNSFITDDRTLEELRVTVNAERISVADTDGSIVASTDPSGEGTSVRDEFCSHLTEDVYTDVLFLLDSDTPIIVSASSLDGGNGLVQITFSADSVVSILQDADLSNAAANVPLYAAGTTAVLDTETLEYISCTDTDLIDTVAQYDSASLHNKKVTLDIRDAENNKIMVHSQTSGDYIILAVVPYSEMYHMRNIVVGWVACGGALMLLITCLALRMSLLQEKKSK